MNHIVLPVEEAIVHIYSSLSFPSTLLVEEKPTITGAYRYDLHTAHTPCGQYHLHVYLKNNQIFAINWDGTAHDQSHRKVIPGKVFKALKEKFPDLQLTSRIIECISPGSALFGVKTAAQFDSNELLELKMLITEEVQQAGNAMFPAFSRFAIYQGDYVPFIGWPFLLMGVEYQDHGDAVGEGYLVWMQGSKIQPEVCRFAMKPMELDYNLVSRLEMVFSTILQCAKTKVQVRIDQQWAKDKGFWAYPKFEFHERPFLELLRLWLSGAATEEFRSIHGQTTVANLKENLDLIIKLTPFKPTPEATLADE